MTEHDKLAILNTINKSTTEIKKLIKAENAAADINTAIMINDIKNGVYGILKAVIKSCIEENNCKIIWEGLKAIKIIEKEDKEDEKWNFEKSTG